MGNRDRIIELLTEVRYTTNDIEKVADEICLLFNVVGQSKQLVCSCKTEPQFRECTNFKCVRFVEGV